MALIVRARMVLGEDVFVAGDVVPAEYVDICRRRPPETWEDTGDLTPQPEPAEGTDGSPAVVSVDLGALLEDAKAPHLASAAAKRKRGRPPKERPAADGQGAAQNGTP